MSKARDLANAGTALTSVSATELGYLDGVTSAVQTQIDAKAASSAPTLTAPVVISPEERTTVSATAATGTVNFDASTQGVLYYTTNASGNWTLNVRGTSSTTLNSILATGDAITVSFLVTNGSTAYYQTAFTIDGTSVTPKYSGGTAPSAGNASAIDAYSFTIIKTGSATFTVLGAGPVKYA
jgi:VCBS repeat-containing protein